MTFDYLFSQAHIHCIMYIIQYQKYICNVQTHCSYFDQFLRLLITIGKKTKPSECDEHAWMSERPCVRADISLVMYAESNIADLASSLLNGDDGA